MAKHSGTKPPFSMACLDPYGPQKPKPKSEPEHESLKYVSGLRLNILI